MGSFEAHWIISNNKLYEYYGLSQPGVHVELVSPYGSYAIAYWYAHQSHGCPCCLRYHCSDCKKGIYY